MLGVGRDQKIFKKELGKISRDQQILRVGRVAFNKNFEVCLL